MLAESRAARRRDDETRIVRYTCRAAMMGSLTNTAC